MHFSHLPPEIQWKIFSYLLVPLHGVESRYITIDQRSPFNISLTPLRVSKSWREVGTAVFKTSTFIKVKYPGGFASSDVFDIVPKIRNLRVDAKLWDGMDIRETTFQARFVETCRDLAWNCGINNVLFSSVTVTFRDSRYTNSENSAEKLSAGLCQGLQYFRAVKVHTENLPVSVEKCLESELLSKTVPTDLLREITRLFSACSLISKIADKRNDEESWKIAECAAIALTPQEFQRHQNAWIVAMRSAPGLENVLDMDAATLLKEDTIPW